ncbi:hypothetical protein BKK44_08300 [Bacillus cereus]|nr:hypothetical protein BKK44_08300 [Bacillus cereus]
MESEFAINRLVQKVKEYADGRSESVSRGAETPRLAALLLQKYGLGIADAIATIYDTPRAADPIFQILDEETMKIDPQWKEHNQVRWTSKPADIAVDK